MLSRTVFLGVGVFIVVCLQSACTTRLRCACSPPRSHAQVLESLQNSEKANRSVWDDYWNGEDVDVVQAIDSKAQEDRANYVIKKLKRQYRVSDDDIQSADWVSPRSISSARRAQAIEELKACGKQWQWRPEHMAEALLADGVVKKLKLDEDLPWSEIFNACRALKKRGCYTELCCKP